MRRSRCRGDCSAMAASSSARDRSGSTSTASAGRSSSGGSTSTGMPSRDSQQRQPAAPSGTDGGRASGCTCPGGTSVPSKRSVRSPPSGSVSVTRYRIVHRSSLSRACPESTAVTRSRPSRSSGTDATRAFATRTGSAAATNQSGSSRSGPSTSTTVSWSTPDPVDIPHVGNATQPSSAWETRPWSRSSTRFLPREDADRAVGGVRQLSGDRARQPAGGAGRVGSLGGRRGRERAERHHHGDDDRARPLPSPAESLCVRQCSPAVLVSAALSDCFGHSVCRPYGPPWLFPVDERASSPARRFTRHRATRGRHLLVAAGERGERGVYSCIVVGTDGSDTAAEAVRHAAELARIHGARLNVVSAYSATLSSKLQAERELLPEEERWMVSPGEQAERVLVEAAKTIEATTGVSVETHALPGDPAEVIIQLAETLGAELVVVGNKGMSGITRVLLGRVPSKVAHHASCSVLIGRTT